MRADVVDDVTGTRNAGDLPLYVRFMLPAPETGFFRDPQMQPQALCETGFHLHPDFAAGKKAPASKSRGSFEAAPRARPSAQRAIEDRPLHRHIRSIYEQVSGVHQAFSRKYPMHCS
jgi:hypothetical protein